MTRPPLRSPQGKPAGFTLIEVAIAVGILAVALVALLGLMPVGMTNFRKAMDTSITAQIAQRILLDMQQADFDQIIDAKNDTGNTPPTFTFTAPSRVAVQGDKQFRYFDDQGVELVIPDTANGLTVAQKAAMVYQVNVRIMPKAAQPANAKISGEVALVTVQVARNPGKRTLPVYRKNVSDEKVSYRNLYDPTDVVLKRGGVQIYTYSALIGKNQG
jgi:uncharacterized protein (TIGR02598 family)